MKKNIKMPIITIFFVLITVLFNFLKCYKNNTEFDTKDEKLIMINLENCHHVLNCIDRHESEKCLSFFDTYLEFRKKNGYVGLSINDTIKDVDMIFNCGIYTLRSRNIYFDKQELESGRKKIEIKYYNPRKNRTKYVYALAEELKNLMSDSCYILNQKKPSSWSKP